MADDFPTTVADLKRHLQQAIDRLAHELKRIDEKIAPVIKQAEAGHSHDPLYNANLELKLAYIEQEKQAVIVEALVSIQLLVSASLDLEVRRAQVEADAAAAHAVTEKAQHAAEKKAQQDEADAQAAADNAKAQADADKAKADADVKAAQAKADADKAKADADKTKADNNHAAALAKVNAERAAARADADSDQKANDAKEAAALKKAQQEESKAMVDALNAAAVTLKASAATIAEIKKMKDDLHKEITDGGGGAAIMDGPAH